MPAVSAEELALCDCTFYADKVYKYLKTNIQIYIMIIISICNHTNNTGIDMLLFCQLV